MSDCDSEASLGSTFDFDNSQKSGSSSSLGFGDSIATNLSSGGYPPPSTMRRKRSARFSFDTFDSVDGALDTLDEHMDSLDKAVNMAPSYAPAKPSLHRNYSKSTNGHARPYSDLHDGSCSPFPPFVYSFIL